MIKTKKAAMEMSVGTIVTIVLLMTVLVLGLVLVKDIFTGSRDSIQGINQAVKDQINKLFAEDSTRKIVLYPETREIRIKKGEDESGFGFSIRNVDQEAASFSYTIAAEEVSCNIRFAEAEDLIALGKTGNNIQIAAGSVMENPIFVRFNVPDTAPPCKIRYSINLKKGTEIYGSSAYMDLTIESA